MRRAYFTDLDAMATFCAALMREGITFEIQETAAVGRYVVDILEIGRA